MSLLGKNLICTQDWDKNELLLLLNTALEMKASRFDLKWSNLFKLKNFLMMFYSPSVRTHLSFTAAATELGGHAQYLEPKVMSKLKTKSRAGETIEDAARVMSQYMAGIGIRIMESSLSQYGEGHQLIKEYVKYAKVPVINMADDVCHPCQSLADLMGWAEWFSRDLKSTDFHCLQGKKLLVTWAHGSFARSWNSPQGSMLLASRFGMDITIARPDGYDMDPEVYKEIKKNCQDNGRKFEVVNDPVSGYENANIVYSRNWISPEAYQKGEFNKEREIKKAANYQQWITTEKKMLKTEDAIFTHPMPIDRGFEVEDCVASGKHSVIYNVANNRLHVQKSIIAHTMGNKMD
jgi:N-acetylornithine carbamoyltransferase